MRSAGNSSRAVNVLNGVRLFPSIVRKLQVVRCCGGGDQLAIIY